MVDEDSASRTRALLQHTADLLISAYRDRCRTVEDRGRCGVSGAACAACSAIAEVQDMMRFVASSALEATALCAHFERELRELRAECPPRTAA
ncbi:hypothetical protein [Leucobacter chromiireducens]|uniref:hypothetical protein n=1 Tax=Leucobacter chromiireducens TaxID=283877 RepID=UPI000F62E3A5|nr:hypothetical protein [Leucobacter chromiireducens]